MSTRENLLVLVVEVLLVLSVLALCWVVASPH